MSWVITYIAGESPLILSFSPWEKGRLNIDAVRETTSPLPEGEGQGEGWRS